MSIEFHDGFEYGGYLDRKTDNIFMGDSYRFQEAYSGDQSLLSRLDAKCYDYPLEAFEWEQILSSTSANNPLPGDLHRYKCMTYRINSNIIGYYVYDGLQSDEPYLQLLRFGVHPDHRQKGLGTMIMDNAKMKASSMGLKDVEIMIPEYWLDPDENRGIISFVDTTGMVPVDHIRDFYLHYGRTYDAIKYRTGGRRKPELVSV